MNLTLLTIGLLVFIGVFAGLYAVLKRTLNVRARLSEAPEVAGESAWREHLDPEKLLKPLGGILPRPASDLSRMEKRLVSAGIRRKDGTLLFYGAQVALAGLLFVASIVTNLWASNPLLFLILSVLFGALIPDLWLKWRSSRRRERVEQGLPDALDLMVVCVEAGLGLDQTIQRISQDLYTAHPDLCDELRVFTMEVNAGRGRADALRNLGQRAGVDDMRSLAAVLIQTDRFGTSIAQSLRVFSDTMRTKRRQRAEERAAKMGVKMIPPMVVFVFPAIFVVIIGPALIGIIHSLLPFLGEASK